MEETERDNSPDLSESFEIYLEQKKKKIQMEKNKLDGQNVNERESETLNISKGQFNFLNSSSTSTLNNLSYNNDSFIELEKMCENTLNLNNVSEVLADLTSLEFKIDSHAGFASELNAAEETKLQEIEQPSFFLNNTSSMSNNEQSPFKTVFDNNRSTGMEATAMSLSYKTTHSHCPSVQSIMSSNQSEYYRTANDKSFESTKNVSTDHSFNLSDPEFNASSLNLEKKSNDPDLSSINDTLDEIDFLLSQAQKLNDHNGMQENILQKTKTNYTPLKQVNSPKSQNKPKTVYTPKSSPLITFSPLTENKSPLVNFKHPKPISSSKNPQFSRINSKKFQHIVSPVSRYIQTSESVLNANAHVHYKGMGAKRQFNFRDSENFDRTHDISVKVSSLPLRAKTNTLNTQVILFKILKP
jgi:hypothetical protein